MGWFSANFLPYSDTLNTKATDSRGPPASKKNSVNKTDIKYPKKILNFVLYASLQ